MPINKNEITKEMLEKAMKCKTAEDLMALAKAEGVAITKDEAEAYMAELADVELDGAALKKSPVVTAMRWMAVWKKDVIGIFESGFSSPITQ